MLSNMVSVESELTEKIDFFSYGREHGSKTGSGGTNSALVAEMHRKQMLKNLTLDKIDVSKDPYIIKNHLGEYDCRLCMTNHKSEGNYLAHTKGRRHTTSLARRALRDARLNQGPQPLAYVIFYYFRVFCTFLFFSHLF